MLLGFLAYGVLTVLSIHVVGTVSPFCDFTEWLQIVLVVAAPIIAWTWLVVVFMMARKLLRPC